LASILENWQQQIKIGDFFGSKIFGARATPASLRSFFLSLYFLEKKNNLKKNSHLVRQKKINILTLVLSGKKILNETKKQHWESEYFFRKKT
jgi:hypothetical protein